MYDLVIKPTIEHLKFNDMKIIIINAAPLLVILMLSINVFAQQGRRGNMDPKEMAARQTNLMKDSLNLTTEQLPKVEALNLEYAEKLKVARDESDGDRDTMRSKMRAIMTEKDVTLKEILTTDQWTKLEAIRKTARENGQRRGRI